MQQTWILYQTTNLVNGKIYVGVHKLRDNYRSKHYLGSGDSMQRAIKKYGKDNFKRITLAEFNCHEDAYLAETRIVDEEFIGRTDTYNICLGGKGGIGYNKFIPTPETRLKMSAAQKGRKHSEESKIKISIGNKGNKNFLGHQHSEETKAKMSVAGKGRVFSKEHKTNMRQASTQTKPVIVNGRYCLSCRQAAELNGVAHITVGKRVKSSSPQWAEWRYATKEEIANFSARS